MSKIVEVKDLWFSYDGQVILEDICFSIEEKEFLGLIGPNGAGKSTLLKLLLGLLKPQKGSMKVFDQSPEASRGRIGYVPQHSLFDPEFPITVLEVVLMGLLCQKRIFQRFTKEDKQKAIGSLELLGMADFKDRHIRSLSGGQQQRVFLARALVTEAKLLILDEPLAAIDTAMSIEFYDLLKTLNQKMAIVVVSHDVGVFPNYADRLFCLNRKLYCHDSKEEALKELDKIYGCPIDLISHGVPHRVLKEHGPHD